MERWTQIDPRNYADDPAVSGRAKAFLVEQLQAARADRTDFDATLKTLYNIWETYPDTKYYNGRADFYLPAGNRAIERAVTKLKARLFPNGDDCFDIASTPGSDPQDPDTRPDLEARKALLQYDLIRTVRLRSKVSTYLRQLCTLGTGPWATDYVSADDLSGQAGRQQYRLARNPDQAGRPLMGERIATLDEIGPTGRPVDLFTFYVTPATVNDLKDAVLVFEDQLVTKAWLLKWTQGEQPRFRIDAATLKQHAGTAPQNSVWSATMRTAQRGAADTDPRENLYVVTMAYGLFPLDGEDAEPVPCQFAIVNDEYVICVRQNPWWHQSPPYDCARLYSWVDEFYGRGLIYFARKLQYLLNDTAAQTFDGIAYALNPIAALDPSVPDPALYQYRPGALWPVSPGQVAWMKPPDVSGTGFGAIRQLYEQIQEASGVSTGGQYLPTLGIAQGAKTATGQSLLTQAADLDIAQITADLQEQWLEPVLGKMDSLEQQFLPIHGERVLRALGQTALPLLQSGMRIRRDQMQGTVTHVWTGNAVSTERERMQKDGPNMLAILAKVQQAMPPGTKINLPLFVQNLYRSYGWQDADKVIQIAEPGEGFDPALEHQLLAMGHDVDPRQGEPYLDHLRAHDALLPAARAAGWGPALQRHMQKTLAKLQEAGPQALAGSAAPTAVPGPAGPPSPAPTAMPAAPPTLPSLIPNPGLPGPTGGQ